MVVWGANYWQRTPASEGSRVRYWFYCFPGFVEVAVLFDRQYMIVWVSLDAYSRDTPEVS